MEEVETEILRKANTIRGIMKRNSQEFVYLVNKNKNYEIVPCKIIKYFNEGEYICEVEVPDEFISIFRSETVKLSWDINNTHLHADVLRHYMVLRKPYLFGRDMSNAQRLRRELISMEIAEYNIKVENLIKLKYNL